MVVAATQHIVVMGVSGSGKSVVGVPLAERLGYELAEGDDFHPAANIAKMSDGVPLTDEDRWPWLRALADWTRERGATGRSTVLTCSALRRRYRDVLRAGAADTVFVHLAGDKALLLQRMQHRDHFFPPTLLDSQLETLEAIADDENGVVVDIAAPVDEIVADLVHRLR
ncbi:MAG: gluconokinase [Nocardioidaceae bacterium]